MVFLFTCYKTMLGALVENKTWFYLCLQDLLLYHPPFLTLSFGRSFYAFVMPSCFIKVSHLGGSKQGFLSIMVQTLHLTLWNTPSITKTPTTQRSFATHSSWNFFVQSYDFFNLWGGRIGNKLRFDSMSCKSLNMTIFS
jgi:hypothetical protein